MEKNQYIFNKMNHINRIFIFKENNKIRKVRKTKEENV